MTNKQMTAQEQIAMLREAEYPLYYMRDNYTFRRLSYDIEFALTELRTEIDEGWTGGMLCSKREGDPPSVHYNGEKFWPAAREWLEKCTQARSALKQSLAQPAQKSTEISLRLREYASNSGYSHNDYADTMRAAAEEIERYYGGMVAWKKAAEAKDAQQPAQAAVPEVRSDWEKLFIDADNDRLNHAKTIASLKLQQWSFIDSLNCYFQRGEIAEAENLVKSFIKFSKKPVGSINAAPESGEG